jgi:hypothetical protein
MMGRGGDPVLDPPNQHNQKTVARRARPTRSSAAVATTANMPSASARRATRRSTRSRAAGRDSQRRAACANISGTSATPTNTCTFSSEYARGRSNDTRPIDHARPIPSTSMSATDEMAPTATPRPWPARTRRLTERRAIPYFHARASTSPTPATRCTTMSASAVGGGTTHASRPVATRSGTATRSATLVSRRGTPKC